MSGLFFIGTDTGVGKTFITAWVARLLRQQGRKIRVAKPVATGAFRDGDRWLSEDTLYLARAAGLMDELDRVTRWTFPDPVAPPVAARRQGVTLTLAELINAVYAASAPDHALLVEGVGGLLCPLTERETVADLALELGLPIVLVARRALGTLNHTLLSLEVAHLRGLRVVGVIVNQTTPSMTLAEETNVDELRKRMDVPLLVSVPFQPVPDTLPRELASVPWWKLCQERPRVAATS